MTCMGRTRLKNPDIKTTAIMFVVLLFTVGIAAGDAQAMSNADLNGNYLVTGISNHVSYNSATQQNEVVDAGARSLLYSFDGNGAATLMEKNGKPFDPVINMRYSVSSGGILTLNDVQRGAVSPDGSVFTCVQSDNGATESDRKFLVGIKTSSGMDNAKLSGTYRMTAMGSTKFFRPETPDDLVINSYAAIYLLSSDGAGTITLQESGGWPIQVDPWPYSVNESGILVDGDNDIGAVNADGSMFAIVIPDYGAAEAALKFQIAMKVSSGMSEASLTGTYLMTVFGNHELFNDGFQDREVVNAWADTYLIAFDGNGKAVFLKKNNIAITQPAVAYSVADDGALTVDGADLGFVSSDGSIFSFVSTHISLGASKELCFGIRSSTGVPNMAAPEIRSTRVTTDYHTLLSSESSVIYGLYEITIEDPDGTVRDSITSVSVTGPSGTYPLDFDHAACVNPAAVYAVKEEAPQDGVYTFSVTDIYGNTVTKEVDYSPAAATMPMVDRDSYLPSFRTTVDSLTPTLSWVPVDFGGGTTYYQVIIYNTVTVLANRRYESAPTPAGSFSVPAGILEECQDYIWMVRAQDSDVSEEVGTQATGAVTLFSTPCNQGPVSYQFERMWPPLHSWYFLELQGIAAAPDGTMYLTEPYDLALIKKYNQDGQFITTFGLPLDTWQPRSVAVDPEGFVYVTDSAGDKIYKFDHNGQLITSWGHKGVGDAEFLFNRNFPEDEKGGYIAAAGDGYLYVSDTDNHRIQKFTADGEFVAKWGNFGTGDGEFNQPGPIGCNRDGTLVYVFDFGNERVQIFNGDGDFQGAFGSAGTGPGQFNFSNGTNIHDSSNNINGIAVDENGDVYVSDPFNWRIQKFDAAGNYLGDLISSVPGSSADGDIDRPSMIAADAKGNLMVLDMDGARVQKFSLAGPQFQVNWGATGSGEGEFNDPCDMALDSAGNVFVADSNNLRIQKFDPDGWFLAEIKTIDSAVNWFEPKGLTIAASDNLYVIDGNHNRILKFDAGGNFVAEWGSYGTGPGQFIFDSQDSGIAVDSDENVYVVDLFNHRVQKFFPNGTYILEWGGKGAAPGKLNYDNHHNDGGGAIAVDSANGWVYVTDLLNFRVQKFDLYGNYLSGFGEDRLNMPKGIALGPDGLLYVMDFACMNVYDASGEYHYHFLPQGSNAGMHFYAAGLTIHPTSGRLYLADASNHRIQVFKKTEAMQNKAIIVAGGGPYRGNNLWDATQLNANFAYRTLSSQGFSKSSIYYLSSNTGQDLDGNGESDDVDADATNANLEAAITWWAPGAENLVLYLVDHGGDGTFRMSGSETLPASDLNAWLSTLQAAGGVTGMVAVVYDACESGSFIPALATAGSGVSNRIVITSASAGEFAYFLSKGTISFSSYFWTNIFNGIAIGPSFDYSKIALGLTTDRQHPLLDDNAGSTVADYIHIGNGITIDSDVPVIGSVSVPAEPLSDTTVARLGANDVTDADGIARVWATIRSPNFTQGASINSITDLPSVDLHRTEASDDYEVLADGFNVAGTHQVMIYAKDRHGNVSDPKLTSVTVDTALARRAIIALGSGPEDPSWNSIRNNVILAYNALRSQGYSDDEIYLLSPVEIGGLVVDAAPTKASLQAAVVSWAQNDTYDLMLYLVGEGSDNSFSINEMETVSADDLNLLLDTLQNVIPGEITVIYDACRSGSFLPDLTPPEEKKRILITSTTSDQSAHFVNAGYSGISFSYYFWRAIANGTDVYHAFIEGKNGIGGQQVPLLDDNGNGIGNEKADGDFSRGYTIGIGIMLAGDDPLIGSVSQMETLSGETSATLWAKDVTTTGDIDKVWAVITPPGAAQMSPDVPVTDLPSVALAYNESNNRWEGSYADFTAHGNYGIAVYALDTRGALSQPATTSVTQIADAFEDDDTFDSANVIVLNDTDAQQHTFHDPGDPDWVKFYGLAGETYEIKTENLGDWCDTVIVLYDTDGQTPLTNPDPPSSVGDGYGYGEGELISWQCPSDGIYYVLVKQYDENDHGLDTQYELRVYNPVGAWAGILKGQVLDGSGNGIDGAVLSSDIGNGAAISFANGHYVMVLPAGIYTITVNATGFDPLSQSNVVIQELDTRTLNFVFGSELQGDIDGDGDADLADAVLVLKVLSAFDSLDQIRSNYAGSGADVDGDETIGMEEMIYIFQDISGL